jgi:large subunit ribosomal protein LP0
MSDEEQDEVSVASVPDVEKKEESEDAEDGVDLDAMTKRKRKKYLYRKKLNKLFDTYKSILIIGIDNVGSSQMQKVRIALRGTAVMCMGKNTQIRSIIRSRGDKKLNALLPAIRQNMGLVFTNGSVPDVKKIIEENKVPAAAKAGSISPDNVFVPPGPTGMDPGQTAFFQALGVSTKIERGNISITSEVHLIKPGEKVTASHVVLLGKMNILPFFYGIKSLSVYENGNLFDAAVLAISQSDLKGFFIGSIAKLAALSFECGYPTAVSVPFQMRYAFKKLVALSLETGYKFTEGQEYIGEKPCPKKGAKKAAAAAEEEEEE